MPKALTDYVKGRGAYDYSHHGRAGNPSTDFVPDEIIDRFCISGAVQDHIAKLRALAGLGAAQFAMYLMHDAQDQTLETYGKHILPALRDDGGREAMRSDTAAPSAVHA